MGAKRPEARAIFLHVPKAAGTTLQTIIERHYRPSEIFFAGTVVHEALSDLRRADVDVRAGIRFATGHMAYGVHDDLPGPSSYFTVLRDPIDRVVSFYYFAAASFLRVLRRAMGVRPRVQTWHARIRVHWNPWAHAHGSPSIAAVPGVHRAKG